MIIFHSRFTLYFFSWDHTRFGVVQYSDDPRTEFLLTDYLTLNEVMSAIDAMPYKGMSQLNRPGFGPRRVAVPRI